MALVVANNDIKDGICDGMRGDIGNGMFDDICDDMFGDICDGKCKDKFMCNETLLYG